MGVGEKHKVCVGVLEVFLLQPHSPGALAALQPAFTPTSHLSFHLLEVVTMS